MKLRTILFGPLMFTPGGFFFSGRAASGLAPCTPVPAIATAPSTAYPALPATNRARYAVS